MDDLATFYKNAALIGAIVFTIAAFVLLTHQRSKFLALESISPPPIFDSHIVDVMRLLRQGGYHLLPKLEFDPSACDAFIVSSQKWPTVILDLSNLPNYDSPSNATTALIMIVNKLKGKQIGLRVTSDFHSKPEQIQFREMVRDEVERYLNKQVEGAKNV
jgi:hypothetical protein